jgi:hypothetical protein
MVYAALEIPAHVTQDGAVELQTAHSVSGEVDCCAVYYSRDDTFSKLSI